MKDALDLPYRSGRSTQQIFDPCRVDSGRGDGATGKSVAVPAARSLLFILRVNTERYLLVFCCIWQQSATKIFQIQMVMY